MKFSNAFLLSSVSFAFSISMSVACASNPPSGAASPQTAGSEHARGHEHAHEHAGVAPALHDFHEVIAPVWHTAEGSARVEKTCSNVKALREKASAAGDAELVAAAAALEPACAKDGRPEVEAKLVTLHNRFHALSDKK